MKRLFLAVILLFCLNSYAQKPCEYTTNVVDSIGKYKTTKEYLLYEKNFGGHSTFIFSSFVSTEKKGLINLQFIEKSQDFIKVKCFDKNSKIYVQLADNKIVTLSLDDEESCGTLVRDDKGLNNRILTGYFQINREDYATLKKSTISFIRIKYSAETADFILKKEFTSELNKEVYQPESYFMDYLHCLEDKN
jgi:hypothetical protein